MTDLQKASLWKRISAALFDFILFGIIAIGAATALSYFLGYDACLQTVNAAYEKYGEEYGIELPTKVDPELMSPEEKANYLAADKALNADKEAVNAFNKMQHLTLLMITFSVLFATFVIELFVPLLFGNGQTLGKKIFGIALMRVDGIKLTRLQLFARSVLGKFTLELMLPIYAVIMFFNGTGSLFALAILFALLISQILCLAIARNGSLLHDVVAATVVVDMASQMIFDTKEEQLEYIKKLHAKQAAEAAY